MFPEDRGSDDLQTLAGLGLTPRQSKIYLILIQLGKASINNLSSTSKIDRANVYRTIKQLQDLKIVEKLDTKPTAFKPLPVNEGILLLLEQSKIKFKENEAEAKILLEKYPKDHKSSAHEKYSNFSLLPDGKIMFNKISEKLESTTKTHEAIVYWEDFEYMPDLVADVWRKLLQRGVEMKVIVFSKSDKHLPEKFREFSGLEKIEVRLTKKRPRTTLAIYDGKTALVSTMPKIYDPLNAFLFMDNAALVGVIQEYFSLLWRNSKPMLQ
ncbi:MAG: hypothetical protein NWE93_09120 [Candidatus Bathyarchaeota archaeon]|nr:hypothetical protein [Candidatus Bathyarchaeota archaeon]